MAKKSTNSIEVEKIKTSNNEVLVFRPRMKLTAEEFKILDEQIRLENKKSGVKIVLMPYSCEVVEDVK